MEWEEEGLRIRVVSAKEKGGIIHCICGEDINLKEYVFSDARFKQEYENLKTLTAKIKDRQ